MVSAITGIYRRGLQALSLTPSLEDQGTTLSPVSILVRPVRRGWPYQESKTPADIALWANESRKPLHHGKGVVFFEFIFFCLLVTIWHYFLGPVFTVRAKLLQENFRCPPILHIYLYIFTSSSFFLSSKALCLSWQRLKKNLVWNTGSFCNLRLTISGYIS